MQKTLIIAVFGALLLLCVGGQMYSINRTASGAVDSNKNYYYMHQY